MKTAPRRTHDDLRRAVTDSAERIVRAEGLAALTARRIARESGVSVGTLYNLFDHLDGLIRAVNMRGLAGLAARARAAFGSVDPDSPGAVPARLKALAAAYLDFALDEPQRWRAMFEHRPTTPGDPRFKAVEDQLFAMLAEAAGFDPAAATADQMRAVKALWAAVHGVATLAVADRLDGDSREAMRAYAGFVVDVGLAGYRAIMTGGEAGGGSGGGASK